MRILMLVHSLRRGGAERVLLEIAVGLQQRGHQVEVVAWLNVDEYQDACFDGVKRHYLLSKNNYRWMGSIPSSAVSLRKVVGQFKPDVIEIHTPNVAWVAAWACLRTPCIHVLHGYVSITRFGTLKDVLFRYLSRLVDRRLKPIYVTVSKPIIPVAASFYLNADQSRFTCVPNGIDLKKFIFKHKIPSDDCIILMLGNLSLNKGQALGIRAYIRLLDFIPNATLTIVGDGPDLEALEALVQVSGLTGKVNFLGRREDVPEILATADILWQLSESEAMPLVVLEAMATGVPVIGFDVRGTRDAIVDKQTGYLVPYGDLNTIVDTTVKLLNDVLRYQTLALNGNARVNQFYSSESMVEGHEHLLEIIYKESSNEEN